MKMLNASNVQRKRLTASGRGMLGRWKSRCGLVLPRLPIQAAFLSISGVVPDAIVVGWDKYFDREILRQRVENRTKRAM